MALHLSGGSSHAYSYDTPNRVADLANYSFLDLLRRLFNTWKYPLTYLLHRQEIFHPRLVAGGVTVLLALCCISSVFWLMHKNRLGRAQIALVLALGILLPFGVNCLYLINTTAFHHLEIYSYYYLYIACFMIYDICPPLKRADLGQKLAGIGLRLRAWLSKNSLRENLWTRRRWLFCLLPAVLVLNNIIYANQVYTKKDLIYQQTLSVMTRVVYRMEETEGYVPGETPVVFVGSIAQNPLLVAARPEFQSLRGVGITTHGTGISSFSLTYPHTYQWYFEHVLATPMRFADTETATRYEETREVQNMPAYPDEDAFQILDGVLVCKLSEEE